MVGSLSEWCLVSLGVPVEYPTQRVAQLQILVILLVLIAPILIMYESNQESVLVI